jgi:Tol biopolymer transport system component
VERQSLIAIVFALLGASTVGAQGTAPPPRPAPNINGGLPSVSPTGRHVAYVRWRDGVQQVMVVPAVGGEPVAVFNGGVQGGQLGWTADGSEVLIPTFANDTTRLIAVRATGTGQPRTLSTLEARDLALSPDGRRLLYVAGRMSAMRTPGVIPVMKPMVADLNGANALEVTDRGAMMTFNGTWSSDGRRIAYARVDSTRRMEVWVMNADGGGQRSVARLDSLDGSPQWPSWSADGTRLAVQAGRYDRQDRSQSTAHIWVFDVATGRGTKLAPHERPYLDETPSFFPDGRIAFQSDRSGRMEIWVMNADGTGAKQVTR